MRNNLENAKHLSSGLVFESGKYTIIWKMRIKFHNIDYICLENAQYSGKCETFGKSEISGKSKTNSITLIIFVWKMQNKFRNVDYISHTSKINHHTYFMEQ